MNKLFRWKGATSVLKLVEFHCADAGSQDYVFIKVHVTTEAQSIDRRPRVAL